ncbi:MULTISPECIES: hypothetical protein [unclassified Lysinibacillus]|uniref:hypothetical protein n=1 Tax=unclassified Lysinibacillus TaxID=2636778 RepID=UPI001092BF6D|nr:MULTISPECIES: hypothetical protein [unclassified Lysinibacillus]TGN33162.1 hypothetical protein E4L99_15080 [Lysinibacillus sp. S2017]
MDRNTQSALIRQSATMASYAIEMPSTVDMTCTKRDLKGYQASLTLIKGNDLEPFAKQAIVFVNATLKYIRYRTEKNLIEARKQRDSLAQMMTDALAEMGGI